MVCAYGTRDVVVPIGASGYLKTEFEKYKIPLEYFELPHSGHILQNDDSIYIEYAEKVEEYLGKYMQV
ncbi:MAG: hypothetical protein VZR00_06095 [Lachnospiraceae bacterium]|nr:hypothetical protein [Lachnospiraceae bacterium]MEE3461448.1 hypothetical protein [Lachnospiraceae bacterium]